MFSFPLQALRKIATLGLLGGFILAFTQIAAAQDPDDIVRVEASLVQLNVGVVDNRGEPITNLASRDFAIYENDVRQSIVHFEPTVAPFSLVVMLDVSASTLSFRRNMKWAALRFIDALSPHDRVAVIAFDDKVRLLQSFTLDRKRIAYSIDMAQGKGKTELYSALQGALSQFESEQSRRKAIVILTDGLDTGLRASDRSAIADAETDEAAIAAVRPDSSTALAQVLRTADRLGVTIYPLALPSGDAKRLPFPDPQQIGIYHAARKRLELLANRTGGRLSEIHRLEDLGRLYAEVAADLRSLYSIAYQPSSSPRDGRWRTIRVELTRPDLIARTKPGYYAR